MHIFDAGTPRGQGDQVPGDRPRPGDRDRDGARTAVRARAQALHLRSGRPVAGGAEGDDRGPGHDAAAILEVRQPLRLHVQLGLRLAHGDVVLLLRTAPDPRAAGWTGGLPTLGTGGFEWRGFLPELAHPHDIGGPHSLLLNWNNKPAPGWMGGDDAHYGSVQHVELFGPWPKHPQINDVVGVMNKAATQDEIGVSRVAGDPRHAPPAAERRTPRRRQRSSLIDNWVRHGAPTVGNPPGRPDPVCGCGAAERRVAAHLRRRHAPAARDACSSRSRTSSVGTPRTSTRTSRPSSDATSSPPTRCATAAAATSPLARARCGLAIKAGRADLINQHGSNPSAWRIDQGMTAFIPGLIPTTFPTTNRPTYQQVISLAPRP